ncbi:MAG: sel1 repeat family protein, partial [Bdellovibrionales bacterium]|nr:sel1 repeat family protein [Bdellovibrionales bacterium]
AEGDESKGGLAYLLYRMGYCGSGGCSYHLYRWNEEQQKVESLFEEDNGDDSVFALEISPLKSFTNGMRDLLIAGGDKLVWNGAKYVPSTKLGKSSPPKEEEKKQVAAETETQEKTTEVAVKTQPQSEKTTVAKVSSTTVSQKEKKVDVNALYEKARSQANDGKFTSARKSFQTLADSYNHRDSQYALGRMYARGDGGDRNFSTARKYFSKAANQGHPKANYSLGMMYKRGDGVTSDEKKAKQYLQRASELGSQDAKIELASLQTNSRDEKLDRGLEKMNQFMQGFGTMVQGFRAGK